jgi:L-asparaginase II
MLRAGLKLPAGPEGGDELVALAAASHSGEPFHLDGVLRILAAVGLGADSLQNTVDHPLGDAERIRWYREGRAPSALAQNCSGKHAAMLATCVTNGWPTAGYLDPVHPLQQHIHTVIEELTGSSITAVGVDGCGAPVHAVPLSGLASAFGRLAAAGAGGGDQPEARLARAASRHPQWLGGTGRWVSRLLPTVPGLVAKDGAEAVFAAGLPDGRGLAVKVADGGERAIGPVVVDLLISLGVPPSALAGLEDEPVFGHGRPVGAVLSVVKLA